MQFKFDKKFFKENLLNTRLKRILILSLCIIFLAAATIILFISPIVKYLVEKYDEKYTGRKITMSWAYVNPFTGYVYFSNVKIYEEQSDSVALSVGGLSGNFGILKMISGNYEIDKLVLDHPKWMVIQKSKKIFNFSSFIEFIKSEHPDTTATDEPSHFNILNVKIKEGEFHYLQEEIPVTYFIKGANIESDGKLWNADSVVFKFFFVSGPASGSMEGTYTVNFKNKDFHYSVIVQQFDLTPLAQYLKDIANYGTFRAYLDANLKSIGNFRDVEDVTSGGQLAISDFHFGKNKDEDYASFEKLKLVINEVSPMKRKYMFDSVLVSQPYFKYEQYDHADNLETMFGKEGVVQSDPERFNLIIEIARYVRDLGRNFFHSYYKINNLAVDSADFKFNDYALNEKFSVAVNPLSVKADSIDKIYDHGDIFFKAGIKPYGNLTMSIRVNTKDTGNFDMRYSFRKIPAAMFDPYLISYTSFPLDRGTIELNGTCVVRNGKLDSKNHLLLIDPRVTKRVKNKNAKWIPLPLVMSFVREYGNVIDYEIPITGSLKDPKFHLRDVLFDILANIFVKPVMTPYRMEVKDLETEIEKSLTVKWRMNQTALTSAQEKFLNKVSDFLAENPKAAIDVYPEQYAAKEKEYILFFEAKKKYFLSVNNKDVHSFTVADSETVSKMSMKDSLFIKYVNKNINDSLLFTMQDKCSKLISSSAIDDSFKKLSAGRGNTFLSFFRKGGVQSRIKFHAAENTVPYDGFSFYKIHYEGELPEDLIKAYQKLEELNYKVPRKKYLKERKKIKWQLADSEHSIAQSHLE